MSRFLPKVIDKRGDCPSGDGIRSVHQVGTLSWARHHRE